MEVCGECLMFLKELKMSCGIRCADHMSSQYRLVQSGKTASGECSAGQGSSEPVAPRIYYLYATEDFQTTESHLSILTDACIKCTVLAIRRCLCKKTLIINDTNFYFIYCIPPNVVVE
jgi:carbohydrate-binding DOMON domain-containing protein